MNAILRALAAEYEDSEIYEDSESETAAREVARARRLRFYVALTKHRLLTNALAHQTPLVPDARERPPTEHEVREHHTGQSDGELRRYYKAGQIQ